MERADDGAARQGEPEALVEERGDFAERDAERLVERHGQREGVRPELDGRRAEGVGGLPRTTALHLTVALRAAADVDAEPSHDRADGGEIVLVLVGHARFVHGPATVGAPRGERRVVGLVEARRHGPLTVASVRGPRLAARALRVRRGRALRERGRLARAGAPRGVQIVFRPLVLATQPIALALQIGALAFDAS
jgi:hypothetical protein